MHLALEWLPSTQPAPQLLILLHGRGGRGSDMLALAQALRAGFPQAALLAPDAPQAFDDAPAGDGQATARQWFSTRDMDDASRPARVAAALPPFMRWLLATQQRLGVGPQATALAGFSQGAILALELASAHDGAVGRVLAFAGRYARLPAVAPAQTTLHLLHGGADEVIAPAHAREALPHLGALHGDATLDIARGVGHSLHPALIDSALLRLRSHIPQRTWRAAMGAAAAHRRDADGPAATRPPEPEPED